MPRKKTMNNLDKKMYVGNQIVLQFTWTNKYDASTSISDRVVVLFDTYDYIIY